MASATFILRERFHLLLIRALATRFAGRGWAVKGGVCLRFFHRSARLSEDLDCDMAATIRRETVQQGVETTLKSRAFSATVVEAGIASVHISASKQTDTTQRWKITLSLAGGGTLPTRLEISRRRGLVTAAAGVPSPELLAVHGCTPFAAPYYDAPSMALQKVLALASPGRHAPRDLFDLDHLLVHCGVKASTLRQSAGAEAPRAAEKAATFSHRDFLEEVSPFLTDELIEAYRGPEPFRSLQRRVTAALRGA